MTHPSQQINPATAACVFSFNYRLLLFNIQALWSSDWIQFPMKRSLYTSSDWPTCSLPVAMLKANWMLATSLGFPGRIWDRNIRMARMAHWGLWRQEHLSPVAKRKIRKLKGSFSKAFTFIFHQTPPRIQKFHSSAEGAFAGLDDIKLD